MFIDTHCHLNTIAQNAFDKPLTEEEIQAVKHIIDEAQKSNVMVIINVGTSLIESNNSVTLATFYPSVYAVVGIHPNDATENWVHDLNEIKKLINKQQEPKKIVGIGECGIDRHYEGYNRERQRDAFKAQIELALEYDLALVIHSRDAHDETLTCLEEYKNHALRGSMHCFSGDATIAQESIKLGFMLGIGGTITYPKNQFLRDAVTTATLDHIILETDAPFLPPQFMRGKKNHPAYIRDIAQYISELFKTDLQEVENKTTQNAIKLFRLPVSQ